MLASSRSMCRQWWSHLPATLGWAAQHSSSISANLQVKAGVYWDKIQSYGNICWSCPGSNGCLARPLCVGISLSMLISFQPILVALNPFKSCNVDVFFNFGNELLFSLQDKEIEPQHNNKVFCDKDITTSLDSLKFLLHTHNTFIMYAFTFLYLHKFWYFGMLSLAWLPE
jgi:hypothetical protein